MKLPVKAANSSYKVMVEAGKLYSWCSCGLSKIQPFCDGAHKGNDQGFKSVKYLADETKIINFCGCKQSKNGMFCDDSHTKMTNDE
jgi:CDGSH-type Zn-finger protein